MAGKEYEGDSGPPAERPDLVIRLGTRSGSGRALGLMKIWRWWEWLASQLWSADPLPGSPYGALRIRTIRYKGGARTLEDGTEIRQGTPVVELHLNNRVLAEIAKGHKWRVMSAVKDELRVAARWAMTDEGLVVTALFGETILGRTAVWLGFEVVPAKPTVTGRLKRLYLSGILQIYSHLGSTRLERGSRGVSVPDQVWMSREELLKRYS